MFGEAAVEDGVAVGFGGAVFEGAGVVVGGCWGEEVGAVEVGFGALGDESWGRVGGGEGTGEGGSGSGSGRGRGRGKGGGGECWGHCGWWFRYDCCFNITNI